MKAVLIALFLTILIAAGFDSSSSSSYLLVGAISLLVLGYLFYSLFRPEKF
ncbi:MAG: K(+)-transporting ATPase subunit F [Bacteroidales bacterium]|nr:K(+)-transporting ATPase subunit F [Bacteroidales bacterium]